MIEFFWTFFSIKRLKNCEKISITIEIFNQIEKFQSSDPQGQSQENKALKHPPVHIFQL
jgi:hypothetical protein